MMPTVSSIVPLHSLAQDDQNVVQYNVFGHAMHMTLMPALVLALAQKLYNSSKQ